MSLLVRSHMVLTSSCTAWCKDLSVTWLTSPPGVGSSGRGPGWSPLGRESPGPSPPQTDPSRHWTGRCRGSTPCWGAAPACPGRRTAGAPTWGSHPPILPTDRQLELLSGLQQHTHVQPDEAGQHSLLRVHVDDLLQVGLDVNPLDQVGGQVGDGYEERIVAI